jgi:hypothetical protein
MTNFAQVGDRVRWVRAVYGQRYDRRPIEFGVVVEVDERGYATVERDDGSRAYGSIVYFRPVETVPQAVSQEPESA